MKLINNPITRNPFVMSSAAYHSYLLTGHGFHIRGEGHYMTRLLHPIWHDVDCLNNVNKNHKTFDLLNVFWTSFYSLPSVYPSSLHILQTSRERMTPWRKNRSIEISPAKENYNARYLLRGLLVYCTSYEYCRKMITCLLL